MLPHEADSVRADLRAIIGRIDEIEDRDRGGSAFVDDCMDHHSKLEAENKDLNARLYKAVEIANMLADLVEHIDKQATNRLAIIRETRTILGANDGYNDDGTSNKDAWESLQDAASATIETIEEEMRHSASLASSLQMQRTLVNMYRTMLGLR